MRSLLFLISVIPVSACISELPDSPLGDDAVALFRNFDADPDALPATLASMDELLGEIDYDEPARKRTFDLPELGAADFEGLTVAEGIDTSDQMRMSMAEMSRHGVEAHIALQTQRNMTCVNADSVVCHARDAVDPSDPSCFIDGSCEVYRTANTLRIESVLDFWMESPADLRRVTLEDGRTALIVRSWIREEFLTDNEKRSWEQRFGLDVFIEDPDDADQTRRYYATWLGPYVDGISGAYLQDALRTGLSEGFENPDDQIDDPTCEISLDDCLAESPL